MLKAWHHSNVTVSDMERSLQFYRDLLGFQVRVDQQPEATYPAQVTGFPGATFRIVFLQLPGQSHFLELIQYKTRQGQPLLPETNRPGSGHICFLVDDLPAVYEQLQTHNVTFVSPPIPITQGVNRGGYAVYMRDPDGATIELLQPPVPSTPATLAARVEDA